jgi:hypothetical protein
MPLTHEPKPLPSELDYMPENSEPYFTKAGDSFFTLADLPQVKVAGLTPSDLCHFNFKTRKETEINWYLKNKVGCTKATKNGKNYLFSPSDFPGIIYLPKLGVQPPVNEYPKTPEVEEILPIWIGVGVKAGTHFVVAGIETITGFVFNLGSPSKGMAITGRTTRLGVGFGGNVGSCLILVTGVTSPQQVNGLMAGNIDYNISLGANWASIGKLKKLKPIIDLFTTIGAVVPGVLKNALKSPDQLVNIVKTVKTVLEVGKSGVFAEPSVIVAEMPGGAGVELSIFHGVTEFNAIYESTD